MKYIILLGLLILSTLTNAQDLESVRIISTEKEHHFYHDTAFIFQDRVITEYIFEIDMKEKKFWSISENGNSAYLDIVNIDNSGTGVLKFKLAKNGRRYTIIVDYTRDIIKTVNKDSKGNIYITIYSMSKIEVNPTFLKK